jgi:uncharacterized protein YerC
MEDNLTIRDNVSSLMKTLLTGTSDNAPFDNDNEELRSFLDEVAYLTYQEIGAIGDKLNENPTRAVRAKLRYLAALFPTKTLHELADTLYYIIDNKHIQITDVRDILRGTAREVPLIKIQQIGAMLREGKSQRFIKAQVGVSMETVQNIEHFIGISEAHRLHLVDIACDAVRESWSVRTYAKVAGIPKSTAHTYMIKARSVLIELGELSE